MLPVFLYDFPSDAVNVVDSRSRLPRIMIACGPFCASCQRALRVEPYSCSSLQQSVEQKLGDWADDAIAESLSQLDDSPSAIVIGALLVLLSPKLNLEPSPCQMALLATVLQWRCPHGVFVIHLGITEMLHIPPEWHHPEYWQRTTNRLCHPSGRHHGRLTGLLPKLSHRKRLRAYHVSFRAG